MADLQVGHLGVNLTRLPALAHRGHALAGDALREKPGGEMQIKLGDNTKKAAAKKPAPVAKKAAAKKVPQPVAAATFRTKIDLANLAVGAKTVKQLARAVAKLAQTLSRMDEGAAVQLEQPVTARGALLVTTDAKAAKRFGMEEGRAPRGANTAAPAAKKPGPSAGAPAAAKKGAAKKAATKAAPAEAAETSGAKAPAAKRGAATKVGAKRAPAKKAAAKKAARKMAANDVVVSQSAAAPAEPAATETSAAESQAS